MSDMNVARRADAIDEAPPTVPPDDLAEIDLEHARWSAIGAFIHLLTPDENDSHLGYFRDPDWSVKDLVAHLGAWMDEAATQLIDIAARSYEPHDVDIDTGTQTCWPRRGPALGHGVDGDRRGPSLDAGGLVRACAAE